MCSWVNKSKIYYNSAITCVPPTIENGNYNCGTQPVGWDGTCDATCSTGYHLTGTETITCNSHNEGTGVFSALPTCEGM